VRALSAKGKIMKKAILFIVICSAMLSCKKGENTRDFVCTISDEKTTQEVKYTGVTQAAIDTEVKRLKSDGVTMTCN